MMNNEPPASTEQTDEQEVEPARKKLRGCVTIIRERCKGCGYCVAFCPAGCLEMSAEFNEKGYHFPQLTSGRDCTGCDLCGMYCPDFAIAGARVPVERGDEESEPSEPKEEVEEGKE